MRTEYIYGVHAVSTALVKTKNAVRLIVAENRQDYRISKCIKLAAAKGIDIDCYKRDKLDTMANANHQGIILEIKKITKTNKERELFTYLAGLASPVLLLALDGVTDPNNLGACLRVADSAGVDALIVPKDKSAKLTPAARKVASGAAETVKFFQVTNLARTLKQLADDKFYIVGADDKSEVDLYSEDLNGNLVLVLGAEGGGMRRLTKEHCQSLVSIPMLGAVSSLNVATAAAVLLYEAYRQRQAGG